MFTAQRNKVRDKKNVLQVEKEEKHFTSEQYLQVFRYHSIFFFDMCNEHRTEIRKSLNITSLYGT